LDIFYDKEATAMSETLFISSDYVFQKIDPISKFVWATIMMVWTLYVAVPEVQLLMFFILLLLARVAAGLKPLQLIKSVRAFFLLGVFMIIFQTFFANGKDVIWAWGFIRATREGLAAGLNVGLRLIVIITISMILAITTDPRQLVASLITILHMPYRFAYALYSTLRFIPLMRNNATVIMEAQTIRGATIDQSLFAKVKHFIWLVIPLIVSGLQQASMSAIALDSRAFGYKATRTNLTKVHVNPIGPIFVVVSLAIFILYIILGPQAQAHLLY
jgi:energy-coupling factor transport system permease protein